MRAQRGKPVEVSCGVCNKSFTVVPSRIKRGVGKFCSFKCRCENLVGSIKMPLKEKFWSFVVKSNGCWNWQGTISKMGYGVIRVGELKKSQYAHRISYILNVGEIPDGLVILHKCDNPRCVNPDHLTAGTQLDNIQDMVNKGRHWAAKLKANKS